MERTLSRVSMRTCLLSIVVATLATFQVFSVCAAAQDVPTPAAQSDAGNTLNVTSRLVITDVTVTDRNGKPVHGLKASSFHLFDGNKPQALSHFEEHQDVRTSDVAPALPWLAPGVVSNRMENLPAVLNVLVIDTTNIEIEEQMYLSFQLLQFVSKLPADQSVAVYARNGPISVMMQGFTKDHVLLAAAVRKAVPRIPPNDRPYLSDLETLHQLAVYLAQLPGRKNILWFSGGSTAFLQDIASGATGITEAGDDSHSTSGAPANGSVLGSENSEMARAVYDELETGRIAVYPIDARGLSMNNGSSITAQHMQMDEVAEATGGHAYYNNNGLSQVAAEIISADSSFYTLAYAPHNAEGDNRWHKVRVQVNGESYQLSYRRGYYAGNGEADKIKLGKLGSRAHAGAANPDGSGDALPDQRSQPIVFEARVIDTPAQDKDHNSSPQKVQKGTASYTIQYSVPAESLTPTTVDGQERVVLGVVAIAFDQDGLPITRTAQKFTLALKEDKLRANPHAAVTVSQQINLRKGQAHLYLAVWDMHSGRLGTLQTQFDTTTVKK
jgi:VWFA-related protein